MSGSGLRGLNRKALFLALWDYEAVEEDELSLHKGDMVCASVDYVENSFGEWMYGENSQGKTGKFPATYVRSMVARDSAISAPLAMNAKIDPDQNDSKGTAAHVFMKKADQSLRQYVDRYYSCG